MKTIIAKSIVYGNREVFVDDKDYDYLNQFKWHLITRTQSFFYAIRTVRTGNGKRKTVWMHREVLGLKNDTSILVDHRDRNGLNNQRDNLRICNKTQNNANRASSTNSTSKYLGVSIHIKKVPRTSKRTGETKVHVYKDWRAAITTGRKTIYLGTFKTEWEAAAAYNEAAVKHHGEFANLNKIIDENINSTAAQAVAQDNS